MELARRVKKMFIKLQKNIHCLGFKKSQPPLFRFAQKHKITFVFNLCGEYVCEDITYVENVLAILPFIDILFGNLSEFEVFIDTIEAKLDTSSSVIRNLRAMIRSEGVDDLDMKIENICESPVWIHLDLIYASMFSFRCVRNQRAL